MKKYFISLEKKYYWLFFISLYFFALSSWILSSGIPGGVDTNSHLFKILYLSNYGLSSSWCHAWYGGYPFLLFYPPLSYYIAAILFPNNSVLSIKVISILFFSVTPSSVYFLAKNLNFSDKESILASFLLGISPVFIMNLLYYGRYPNVIAFPLVCLGLGTFLYTYKKRSSLVIPGFVMGLLILVHHLSAFIGFFLLFLFSIFEIFRSRNLSIIRQLALVTLIALAIGAVWIMPFIANISYYGSFFNPSLPILSLKFLLRFYIAMIGLSHIILSIGVLLLISFYKLTLRNRNEVRKLLVMLFFSVIIFYTFYAFLTNGLNFTIKHLLLLLICVIFLLFIYLLPQFTETYTKLDINTVFNASWFLLFFWLTLGPRAILFAILPFSQTLDILRFMLYASIPVSLLGARMFLFLIRYLKESYHSISSPNKLALSLLLSLISFSFIVPFIQPRYGQGGILYVEDIFQQNQEIPQQLIAYLKDSQDYGRILSINSPSWIYSLAFYADKPLVDGWFPQARFLYPFSELSSYTINDLSASEQWVWDYLIDNASLYGIKWVLIGDEEKLQFIEHTQFHLVLQINSLFLYEANFDVTFIDIENGHAEIVFDRPNPNKIVIYITDASENLKLLVKEVYFPHWHVEDTFNEVEMKKSEIGFISLIVNSENTFVINLVYEYPIWQQTGPILISVFALLICCVAYFRSEPLKHIQIRLKKFLKQKLHKNMNT